MAEIAPAQSQTATVVTEISEADRLILRRPLTRQTRQYVAMMLAPHASRIDEVRAGLPSYVSTAIDALRSAFERWEVDERAALLEKES